MFALALKDLNFDRLLSLCVISAAAAVIAPLLLLFSLRFGIVQELQYNLSSNPVNLELVMGANYQLSPETIAALEADPDAGFVIPKTRSLSTTVDVRSESGIARGVEALPSKEGDPLLSFAGLKGAVGPDTVFVSAGLADKLQVKDGDEIKLIVPRQVAGQQQRAQAVFKVLGVVDRALLSRESMLVSLDTLIYMEDYRDGYEPPVFSDGSRLNEGRRYFAKVRLYASSLDSVAPLSARLSRDYTIYSKLNEINNVKAITRVLDFIFEIIALVSAIGGTGAVCGLILSSLNKKTKTIALMRMMGFGRGRLIVLTMLENSLLALSGFLLAALLSGLGSWGFNTYFAGLLSGSRVVSSLRAEHYALFGAAAVVLMALLSGALALWQLNRSQIADVLREA